MYHVLIIEDDPRVAEFLAIECTRKGYQVTQTAYGKEGLFYVRNSNIDLILLDVVLHDINGIDLCHEIRQFSKTPVIMITGKDSEIDHLRGYHAGVDDYISKPFRISILMAKIENLFKRYPHYMNDTFTVSGLTVHISKRTVTVDGIPVHMTTKEFDLLVELISHQGVVIPRGKLLDQIWGHDYIGGTRVVDNHIKKVRSKLGSYSSFIQTIVSVGYKFEEV